MYVAGYEVNCGRCCCCSEKFIIFLMINRVVSSFQRLRASSLVAAFVLNLLLSIFFCLYYLYFIIGALSAYSHCNFFCVFCLVAAVLFFASISLLVHCFVAFMVCLLCC